MENCIIEHVHIEGLWNKYTVDFPLDEDVNILVGNNGVGKTTILNILILTLMEDARQYPEIANSFHSAIISFSNDYSASITSENGQKILCWRHKEAQVEDGITLPIKYNSVSSFDTDFIEDSYLRKLKSVHSDIKSDLDARLYDVIDGYYRYQSMLGASLRELVSKKNMEGVFGLYALSDKVKNICNELFADKVWYENEKTEGKLLFQTKEDGVLLKPSQLSSGEKQLLILLLTTLGTNGRNVSSFGMNPKSHSISVGNAL